MQGISVWDRYHGERYFLHDMVRWTTVVVYRICGNNDINRYCDYLWNCQWSGSGMAGYVTYENDRDFAEHSQSAFGYFSAGDSGEGKCAESVAGYRSYKLDSIAKVVRTEVRQLRSNEYVVAARCMGGGFFYILRKHLAPNFLSSIMFMVVMNIRSAIVEESTLSFMGIWLPLEIISWGSMLSLSEKALLTDGWWIILIPGAFLVVTLLAITGLGDYLRKELNKKESYL